MTGQQEWRRALGDAVRKYRGVETVGFSNVEFAQHARLLVAMLEAFGDDNGTKLYVEGMAGAADIPRPDVILLHPQVGVLVVENKGVTLESIHAVRGGEFTLVRDFNLTMEDPYRQAERVMFRLKDLCKQHLNLADALFLRTVAFPRMRRSEVELRFHVTLPPETLFSDAVADPRRLREQVLEYAKRGQEKAKKGKRLTKRASEGVMNVLMGRALFYAPRQTFVEETHEERLGVRIQNFELGLKEPTQQQKELGRGDLRGAHRLFRGVAGSGKSIMLALNAAQTLLAMTTEAAGLFEHKRSGRVLVCCYNRTLVPYLRSKIEERYGRISWDAPAEGALTVTHFEGLVRELEKHAGMATGLTFEKKEERAKALCAAFDRLPPDQRQALVFDAVYVDEAQDLLPAELEFLRRLARDEQGKQTLIIFYDNAQNIYGVTQPTWGDLGINIVGRTVFMDTCLRNTEQTLKLAFNVLVGSFAAEGEKVATRQFADVAALKSRKLISEEGEAYGIHFAPRRGPAPEVRIHANRREEAAAVVQEVRRLIEHEQVLPSDILVLYISHKPYAPWLEAGLREALAAAGPAGTARDVRLVDADHHRNKNTLLLEDGVLTASTIASAKGYDAAVVFLLGADLLPTDVEGRALFYVGATRSKMVLKVSGVGGKIGLLPEIVRASEILAGEAKAKAAHLEKAPAAEVAKTGPAKKKVCRACGSERLHAQHGRFGYFYRCIDCTENTPMDKRCAQCGKEGRVRKDGFDFFLECAACATSLVIHRNVPLETL